MHVVEFCSDKEIIHSVLFNKFSNIEIGDVISIESNKILSFNEFESLVEKNVFLLLTLAKHYFYLESSIFNGNLCSILHYTLEECINLHEVFNSLFEKVLYIELKGLSRGQKILRVNLYGISKKGKEFLYFLKEKNKLPKEVEMLYIGKSFANDNTEEGLYRIYGTSRSVPNKFYNSLLCSKFYNSVDVSSFELEKCIDSEICHYFLSNQKKVFIYVDYIADKKLMRKQLIWC